MKPYESIENANDDLWKEEIRTNVTRAFETVHDRFLDRITTMTTPISEVGSAPQMDQSGTTATALLVTQDVVIAAVLGDSRGILASAKSTDTSTARQTNNKRKKWKDFPEVSAIPFSIDHVASDPTERKLILQRGGFVSVSGETARVNGTLAITRSIGDANLSPVLSREPHVRAFYRSELRELCGDLGSDSASSNGTAIPCFAILGKSIDLSQESPYEHRMNSYQITHRLNVYPFINLCYASQSERWLVGRREQSGGSGYGSRHYSPAQRGPCLTLRGYHARNSFVSLQ